MQSAYYDALLPKLVPSFKTHMPAAGSEVGHFVRPVVVAVTSLFVDRCIRVLHRIRQQQGNGIAVVGVEPLRGIQWLRGINNSWHLNQELIQRIMLALGFETVHVFDQEEYPEYPSEHSQRNLVFRPQRPGLSGILTKLSGKYYMLLRRIPSARANIISKGLAYDEFYAAKRGLYGPFGLLRCDNRKIQLEPSPKNEDLRADLLREIEPSVRPKIESLLAQLCPHLRPCELTRLRQAYVHLLIEWFPIGFLEGLSSNLEKTNASLQNENVVGIIGSELSSDLGYFESASARLAGKAVIAVQDGGRFGYIEDLSISAQLEYPLYDKLITWGWTRIDRHLPQCETIPLPCQKFSEQPLKANYIRSAKRLGAKIRDVLFMSSLFHRFPHASTCGQARVDFIDEITGSQEDLMRAITDAGLTVDHKPYNMKYVDLYPEHYRRLDVAGGAGYRLLKSTHKGLTVEQIQTCRIVLWDQIGTGTLECFTSDIPTIVYWKRLYSREAPYARELVAGLERCGVVHTDARELAREINTYLDDPEGWMVDKERKKAIRAFCQKFALTDSRWYISWKRQLSQWSDEGRR